MIKSSKSSKKKKIIELQEIRTANTDPLKQASKKLQLTYFSGVQPFEIAGHKLLRNLIKNTIFVGCY